MLFLVISTPAPTRPSEVRDQRKKYWPWIQDKLDSGLACSVYPRTGRGAVVIFDVDSHETLHHGRRASYVSFLGQFVNDVWWL